MPTAKEHTTKVIRLFFMATCLFLYAAVLFAPDKNNLIDGLLAIWYHPATPTTDFFAVGGAAAGLLNAALTATLCTVLAWLPGAAVQGTTMAAFLMTTGLSFWGVTPVNALPLLLGIYAYSRLKKQPFGNFIDSAIFSTALGFAMSALLIQYPDASAQPFNFWGLCLALFFGWAFGLAIPPLTAHAEAVHKGFSLYSAGLPVGLLALSLSAVMYKTMGIATPALSVVSPEGPALLVRALCIVYFILCLAAGFFLSGKTFSSYKELLQDSGHKASFPDSYGIGAVLMNIGIYGLFITAYYIFTDAPTTGVTLGLAFCMVSFGTNGAHPGNVWPIMLGYLAASMMGVFPVSEQSIAIGLCFAASLAPIPGIYGWWSGVLCAMAHYALVTSFPAVYGGFISVLVAMAVMPLLEAFSKTKAQRMDELVLRIKEMKAAREKEDTLQHLKEIKKNI